MQNRASVSKFPRSLFSREAKTFLNAVSNRPKPLTQGDGRFDIFDTLARELLPRSASGCLDRYAHRVGDLVSFVPRLAAFHGSGIALDYLLQDARIGDPRKIGTTGGGSQ
jgi:hypothetical protein